MQLTLEQHGFELHMSTYTWILKNKYTLQYIICSSLNIQMKDHTYGGPTVRLYHGFLALKAVGGPKSCIVQGSTIPYFAHPFIHQQTLGLLSPSGCMDNVIWTGVDKYLFVTLLSILLGTYLEVELLDHMVILFLIFWGTTITAMLFYISTNNTSSSFSISLPTPVIPLKK